MHVSYRPDPNQRAKDHHISLPSILQGQLERILRAVLPSLAEAAFRI